MIPIFKNPADWKIKYAILFFCFAIITIPLLAGAEPSPATAPSTPSTLDTVKAIADFNPIIFGTKTAAKAAGTVVGGILASTIGMIVFVLNYIIATIFGFAVAIISFFISTVLGLNTHIIASPIVSNGFTITLSLANLGFVLAIIVIAIATILRYETYALKQTLWKLVAAAVLVNFSLVIAGAILNFSDTLSFYFLNSINPAGSGSSFDKFATALAGSFAPQRVFLNLQANSQSFAGFDMNTLQGAGQNFSAILIPILNLFFPTIFLIIIVIALAGLFIMLLIRYIYIGILLILMPMAWLLWIFPVTAGQWHKWWSKFIQWTMFAPVVLFFIWLAILTQGGATAQQSGNPNSYFAGLGFQVDSGSDIVKAAANGGFAAGMLGTLLQMAMMVSMLFAGLFMAQSMGITFADTTLKGASAVTKGFGGFVKRRGIIGAGWAMNKARVPALAEKLQKGVGARPTGLLARTAKYTGLEFAGQKLGEGITALHVATREGTVDEAEKRTSGNTKRQDVGMFPGATNPEKIAIMKRAAQKGYIKELPLKDYLTKELLEAYRIEIPTYKDISEGKGAMLSEEAIKALEESFKPGGSDDRLDAEMNRMVVSTTKAKIGSNANVGDMYGSFVDPRHRDYKADNISFGGLRQDEANKWLKSLTKNIVTANFDLISSALPKMNSKERANFDKLFDEVIGDLRKAGNTTDADKYEVNYKKIISHITLGYTEGETTAAGAPAGGGATGGAPAGGAGH